MKLLIVASLGLLCCVNALDLSNYQDAINTLKSKMSSGDMSSMQQSAIDMIRNKMAQQQGSFDAATSSMADPDPRPNIQAQPGYSYGGYSGANFGMSSTIVQMVKAKLIGFLMKKQCNITEMKDYYMNHWSDTKISDLVNEFPTFCGEEYQDELKNLTTKMLDNNKQLLDLLNTLITQAQDFVSRIVPVLENVDQTYPEMQKSCMTLATDSKYDRNNLFPALQAFAQQVIRQWMMEHMAENMAAFGGSDFSDASQPATGDYPSSGDDGQMSIQIEPQVDPVYPVDTNDQYDENTDTATSKKPTKAERKAAKKAAKQAAKAAQEAKDKLDQGFF